MRNRRRLSTQILISQLTILLVVSLVGLVLFARTVRDAEDRQYEQRALAVAQSTAAIPQVAAELVAGDHDGTLARLGEQIRQATDAAYVVIIDPAGVRHSHPDPALIGQRVEEPVVVLDGRSHTGLDHGHLGVSANGKAPVFDASHRVVGEVSAGILESEVSATKTHQLVLLVLYAVAALAAGAGASLLLARRLKRQTFGLELNEIADLLQEREAMLHGIREGVVTLHPDGRISLVNDEARRLLGLPGEVVGRRLADVLPPGRLSDLLNGQVAPDDDEVVLTDEFCLKVNRMPVRRQQRDLGAVVTLRDRTEHVGLLRELDSVRTLTDALRAQQHEHANRMHTVAGLLELGRADEAAVYLDEISGSAAGLAEQLRDTVAHPTIVALLMAKVTIARERGVALTVSATAPVADAAVDTRAIVTIVGNLVDNALDAVAGRPGAQVQVRFALETPDEFVVEVRDNGPGVPPGAREAVFRDGYSTKPARGRGHRGLGLALVHRLVTQAGGRVVLSVADGQGSTFTVHLPVNSAAAVPV